MRSRDGNHSLSFSVCSIILFLSLSLSAKEYLISYRYVVKDAILYNESLVISDAMKKCIGIPQKTFTLENNKYTDIRDLINKNSEEFLSYIRKLGIDVKHEELTQNMQNSSTTILTLKTTCFKVDFNDNFANITPIQ